MRLRAKEPVAYGYGSGGVLLVAAPGEEFDLAGDASQLLALGHAEEVPASPPPAADKPAKPAKG